MYPWCQGPTWNARSAFHTPHTASLLIDAQNLFLTLWRVGLGFRIHNTTGSTILTQVLLIAVARLRPFRTIFWLLYLPQLWMWVSVIMVLARQDDNILFCKFTQNHVFLHHHLSFLQHWKLFSQSQYKKPSTNDTSNVQRCTANRSIVRWVMARVAWYRRCFALGYQRLVGNHTWESLPPLCRQTEPCPT